jgi:haloalkane dehalogenase
LVVGVLPRPDRALVPLLTSPRLRRSRAVLGDAFEDRRLLDGEFAEFFLDPLRHDEDRRWALGRFGREFDLRTMKALPDLHRRITAPVRLAYAEHATFFPMRWTREMAAGFGGPAELQLIPGGRLFVHEERPREVAEALLPALLGRG